MAIYRYHSHKTSNMSTTQDCVIQVSYLSDKCDTSSVVAIKGKVINTDRYPHLPEGHLLAIDGPRYTQSFTDAHGNALADNAIVWGHKLI